MTTYLVTQPDEEWRAEFNHPDHPQFLFCRDWTRSHNSVQTIHRVFETLSTVCFADAPIKAQRFRVERERLKRAGEKICASQFRAAKAVSWQHPAIDELKRRWEAVGRPDMEGTKQYPMLEHMMRGQDILGKEASESPMIRTAQGLVPNTSLAAKKAAPKLEALKNDQPIPEPAPRDVSDLIDPSGKATAAARLPGVELIQWGMENLGRDLMEEECPTPAAYRYLRYINEAQGEAVLWTKHFPSILPTQKDVDLQMKRQRQDRGLMDLYEEIMGIIDG